LNDDVVMLRYGMSDDDMVTGVGVSLLRGELGGGRGLHAVVERHEERTAIGIGQG
jgi:hypothetical protein